MKTSLVTLLVVSTSHAFMLQPKAIDGLSTIVDSLEGCMVDLSFNIGKAKEKARLPLQGLVLQLSNQKTKNSARSVTVTQEPFFTNMEGRTTVAVRDASWDLVWKDMSPKGSLICELHVPNDVSRNDAKLKSGRLFLTHSVWTAESLQKERARKADIMKRADEYKAQCSHEFQLCQATNNIFKKIWHYRKSLEALEYYWATGAKYLDYIPSDDSMVKPLFDGFFVSTVGRLMRKDFDRGVVVGESIFRDIVPAPA